MFVNALSFKEFLIYYKVINGSCEVFSEKEFLELNLDEDSKNRFEILSIKAKPMTWGLYNDLQEGAVKIDALGNRRFNFKMFKESKLLKIIQEWSAKIIDQKSQQLVPAPINTDSVSSLYPEVAEKILEIYDSFNLMTTEEEKN